MTLGAPAEAAPDGGPPVSAAETGVGARRPRRTARWTALVVLVVVAALVALLATRPPATETEVYTPLLGRPAPGITATTLTGRGFDLGAYRGRFVVLNFFASWCPPCQQEQPELVSFAYGQRGAGEAAVVGVVYDDASSNARAFDAEAGANWPAVVDPGGQIALRYGVRAPPETFLISPAGKVVAHIDGAVTAAYLDRQLAAARAGGA
ncbi:MAG TPA: TlpA disulfide reductase family protein [Acidimicrobiales bacterium]|nr:TlpA disulfide reductase family protein [Acidimicrobiales bacterium]